MFESLSIHQKMIEMQLAQGYHSGQLEANPNGNMNAIALRSGKQLDELKAT